MKNLLLTLTLLFVCGLAFGQLKVVAPNGDVGIGTSTPTEKLTVDGNMNVIGNSSAVIGLGTDRTAAGSSIINFSADIGAYPVGFKFTRWANGRSAFIHRGVQPLTFNSLEGANQNFQQNGSTALQILANGNVGIGTLNSADALTVDGDITATGTVTWSDVRLKSNITPFQMGLEQLLQIKPKSYVYNGKAGIRSSISHTGVIAQEFEKIVPSAVIERDYFEERENGEATYVETYKGVDESVITYLLVNSIKEQQAMIETLQAQVEALQTSGGTTTTPANETSEFSQQQMVLSNLNSQEISKISPNPFTQVARIDYNLARDFSSATVTVYDLDGQLINQVTLDSRIGTVEIEAAQLSSGMYTYTIEVDGEVVDTKKFIKE